MKQLDFLFLGLDQVVNSFNIIRNYKIKASFTIFVIIVDSGFEGPQASFNNLSNISSLANIDAFTVNNNFDLDIILKKVVKKSGFRIIGISQKSFQQTYVNSITKYKTYNFFYQMINKNKFCLVTYNLSFSKGVELLEKVARHNIKLDHYHLFQINFDPIKFLKKIILYKKIIILNDTKSKVTHLEKLVNLLLKKRNKNHCLVINRSINNKLYYSNKDEFRYKLTDILKFLN